jgi:general secretion pathway protein G
MRLSQLATGCLNGAAAEQSGLPEPRRRPPHAAFGLRLVHATTSAARKGPGQVVNRGSVASRSSPAGGRTAARGLTLLELLVGVALLAALATIAVPVYSGYRERARNAEAINAMRAMEAAIRLFATDRGRFPDSLDEAGLARNDPWGQPYRYLPLEGSRSRGQARKDRALNPINTDFDLYSVGPDGRTASPLTAAPSRDDLVRGRNGAFIGVASDF